MYKSIIIILLVLTTSMIATALSQSTPILPQLTTCVDTDSGLYSVVTAYASIYSSPQGSIGTGSARTSETFDGSTAFCVVDLAYVQFTTANGAGWSGYIGIPDSTSRTFYNAGNYIETYIKSLCDGVTAFTGAFISGYCVSSYEPIQPLYTLLSK